jgi:hypothetical protein
VKHDVFARMLMEQADHRGAKKTATLSQLHEDASKGIADTVRELAGEPKPAGLVTATLTL